MGELHDIQQCDIPLPAVDTADIVPVQFGKLSQPLLETIHAAATTRGQAGERLLADRNYPHYGLLTTMRIHTMSVITP